MSAEFEPNQIESEAHVAFSAIERFSVREVPAMTVPASLAHTLQQTQEWLKEVRENAGLATETEALSAFRAVIHQLRDRLTVVEAAQLSAELPMLIRGIFYEGWQPAHVPDKTVRSRQDFIDGVATRLKPHPIDAESVTRVVFMILAHHLDPGEISDVIGQLPDGQKELWPLPARTYRERVR